MYKYEVDDGLQEIFSRNASRLCLSDWPAALLSKLAKEQADGSLALAGGPMDQVALPMPNLIFAACRMLEQEDEGSPGLPVELRLLRMITEIHRRVELEINLRAIGVTSTVVGVHDLLVRTR